MLAMLEAREMQAVSVREDALVSALVVRGCGEGKKVLGARPLACEISVRGQKASACRSEGRCALLNGGVIGELRVGPAAYQYPQPSLAWEEDTRGCFGCTGRNTQWNGKGQQESNNAKDEVT